MRRTGPRRLPRRPPDAQEHPSSHKRAADGTALLRSASSRRDPLRAQASYTNYARAKATRAHPGAAVMALGKPPGEGACALRLGVPRCAPVPSNFSSVQKHGRTLREQRHHSVSRRHPGAPTSPKRGPHDARLLVETGSRARCCRCCRPGSVLSPSASSSGAASHPHSIAMIAGSWSTLTTQLPTTGRKHLGSVSPPPP